MPAQLTPGRGFIGSKDPPRPLRPMREPSPAPVLGPVLGDPATVPEDPSIGYEPAPGAEPDEPEPLWLKMPAELADFFDIGFVHDDEICPYVVMRVRDQPSGSQVELSGPPMAFAGLARVIVALCESVPCLARHMDDAYADSEPAERAG
jgi:hypothetical protein